MRIERSPLSELSGSDGDVQLLSTDNVILSAHAHMLKAVSPYFRKQLADVSNIPLYLRHDSFALRTLLQLIYPTNTKPSIDTVPQLISVLQAAKALEITSFAVRETLNGCIEAEPHPLRSWALATAFDYPEARRVAVERYFATDSLFHHDMPEELRLVNGYQVIQLNAAKERAITLARLALREFKGNCGQCDNASPVFSRGKKVGGKGKKSKKQFLEEEDIPPDVQASSFDEAWPIDAPTVECVMAEDCAVDAPPAEDCAAEAPREAYPASFPVNSPHSSPYIKHSSFPTSTVGPKPNTGTAWRDEFQNRTATMNPFTQKATSDTLLELCFLLHPPTCGHESAAFSSTSSQDARDALRSHVRAIFSQEMDILAIS